MTMVSVGRSVCSYVCADLLSTRAALQKGGTNEPPQTPLNPPLKNAHVHE